MEIKSKTQQFGGNLKVFIDLDSHKNTIYQRQQETDCSLQVNTSLCTVLLMTSAIIFAKVLPLRHYLFLTEKSEAHTNNAFSYRLEPVIKSLL